MESERSIDRLARYIMGAAAAAIILVICWYFKSVIVAVIAAAVVSLIGIPLKNLLGKIRIKGKCLPNAVRAVIALALIIILVLGIVTQIVPVAYGIIMNISSNFQSASISSASFSTMISELNSWMISRFPSLGNDWSIVDTIVSFFKDQFNPASLTSMVGSVASTIGSFAVGAFSVLFISFFFIKDEHLFRSIVGAIVPDRYEEKAMETIGDIEKLLSRYFVGLMVEITGVALISFTGLWLVARLGVTTALGIAFMTGILNVIPYVGPWIGGAIGTVLGVILKYSSAAAAGGNMDILMVIITLVAIFAITQMIDNFFFQPVIYSTSIKSSPLEIFIVLIVASNIGGIIGMLLAIPAYTVVRVIAAHFFGNVKAIRRLMEATSEEA
ncbi:MAG: AI-2E family transporter [Candidatus Cryptobacteroides sp.]